MEQPKKKTPGLIEQLRRLFLLYVENVKLTSAEKLSVLFSVIALFAIVMVLSLFALMFIAMGLASMLEAVIAPFWTYFIIAGLFLAMCALLILLRDKLITNPIVRFVSKLFLDAPVHKSKQILDE